MNSILNYHSNGSVELAERWDTLRNDSVVWTSGEESAMVLHDKLAEFAEICKELQQRRLALSLNKDEIASLRIYRIIAEIMDQLIDREFEQIYFLEEYHELTQDYCYGAKYLKSLNTEMKAQG